MTFDAIDRDGLIFSSDFLRTESDIRVLTRAVARGELIKLRRGAYVRAETWANANGREQHLFRARAVVAHAQSPAILAGFSAAAAHGMPVMRFPNTVSLQQPWQGGGRSAPGVRRTSAGHPSVHTEVVNGIECTDIARTALELTRLAPFAHAVGSLDWALWRANPRRVIREAVAAELAELPARFGIARANRVLSFATHLSDSFGESMCRALAFEAGFALPTLQREIRDAEGLMVPDYSWDDLGILGEFDGRGKYLRGMRAGEDPGDVVWREKLREDRLRALGFTLVRIVWDDLMLPSLLVSKLVAAGVPRRG
jgi:hypothetical protein